MLRYLNNMVANIGVNFAHEKDNPYARYNINPLHPLAYLQPGLC